MKTICQTVVALALFSLLNACQSKPVALLPQGGRPVDLTLQASTTDKRYTYFQLKPDGQLSFGGGMQAQQKIAKPVLTLTPAQMQEVWNVIERFGLHQAHQKKAPRQNLWMTDSYFPHSPLAPSGRVPPRSVFEWLVWQV